MNANVLPDVLDVCDNHRKIHPLLYLRGCVFSNLFLPTKKRSKVLWLWIDQNFLHALVICFCFLFWSGLERRFEYGRISRQCTGSVGVGCPRHIRSPCSLQILTQACCTESMKEASNIFSECLWLSCLNPWEFYVVPQPIILLDLGIIWRLISDELMSNNFHKLLVIFECRVTGPNDVRMKVLYCGICHSDYHQIHNDWKSSTYPMVPG